MNLYIMFNLFSTMILGGLFFVSFIKAYKRGESIKFLLYVFIGVCVVYVLKYVLRISRPSVGNLILYDSFYSFPSTHATLGLLLALYLGGDIYLILGILVGLIRIITRVHALRDIVGGWLIALILYFMFFYYARLRKRIQKPLLYRKTLHIIFGSLMLICAIFIYEYFVLFSILLLTAYIILILSPIGRRVYHKVKKKNSKRDYLSPIYWIIASLLIYLLFDRRILLISLLLSSYFDPLSTLIANLFPLWRMPNKRHFFPTLFVAFLIYLFFSFVYPSYALIISFSFILYEILFPSSEKLDDNLFLPLWCAVIIYVMQVII